VTTGLADIRDFSARRLIACLCVLAMVASVFAGSLRSSAAATGGQKAFMSIVSIAAIGAPAKKPCQRGGLVAAGASCTAGVFVGLENSAADLVKRLPKQARLGPVLRSSLATQCCGSPLLRPPRTDV
jgi:hypothetical protein